MPALLIAVSLWVAYHFGFAAAHYEVSVECERVGAFFVGKEVYRCHHLGTASPIHDTPKQP